MGKLYIKGDAILRNKVLGFFEMLYPGLNKGYLAGNNHDNAYYVNEDGRLGYKRISELEEGEEVYIFKSFIEKYPYRKGDKVVHDWGVRGRFDSEVTGAYWDEKLNKLRYYIHHEGGIVTYSVDVERLSLYPSQATCEDSVQCELPKQDQPAEDSEEVAVINMNDVQGSIVASGEIGVACFIPEADMKKNHVISFEHCQADKTEIILGDGYELKTEEDGRIFVVRKEKVWPKTYLDCCGVVEYCSPFISFGAYSGPLSALADLLICRDAYWKLAGGWGPEKMRGSLIPCIVNVNGEIVCDRIITTPGCLQFPTEEIRDIFYENFKDLIEKCKELL